MGAEPVPATRPYARELHPSPRVRRRRVLRWPLGAAAVVLVVVSAAGLRTATSPDDEVIFRYGQVPVHRWAFPGEPWAPVVLREAGAIGQPDPVLGWRNIDVDARYVDVRDGRRATTAPVGDPEAELWLFGGSTAFGVGQRNRGTIASSLVQQAAACGTAVRVENFGVQAYVNWQGTQVFLDELRDGGRPDVAVFYDGSNELAGADDWVRAGLPADVPYVQAVTDAERAERAGAARRRPVLPEAERLERAARLAASQYRRGVLRAREAADEAGVAAVHFWQPRLSTIPADRPRVRDVRALLGWDDDRAEGERRRYAAVREAAGVGPVDLTSVFDPVGRPVFFDDVHTNEHGARLVARAMLAELARRVPALAGADC